MPLPGFAGNGIEKETIILNRALLEIEEIDLNYGDDSSAPATFEVKDDDGNVKFTSAPYINATVTIVDDYGDGSHDGKKFYDKLYLSYIKSKDMWAFTKQGKVGRIFRTIPKYGDKCFDNADTVYDEQDLAGHQFEAGTEQREDKQGNKLQGTRIAYETIGPVPNRNKKKTKKGDKPEDRQIDEAEMAGALGKS